GFTHHAMSSEMHNCIHALEQSRDAAGVLQAEHMQTLRSDVFAMAAGEVIEHGHIQPAIQQVAGCDGADVPGAPGYQDFRHSFHSTIETCASAAASLPMG